MNGKNCPVCSSPADKPCLACQMKPKDYLAVKDVWLQVRPQEMEEDRQVAVDWAVVDVPGAVVARWNWDEDGFAAAFRPVPKPSSHRYFWLELTTHCPHRCRHCFLGDRLGRGHAPAATVHRALDLAAEWMVKEIVISGGEPTMHPDFVSILNHSREVSAHVRLLTNGWTQRPAVIRALAQPGISVEVPLLGFEEDHDWMTQTPGSFQRIRKTLELYREAGIDLTLTTTVTRKTVNALAKLQALANEMNIPFAPTSLSPQGLARENWDDLYWDGIESVGM